MKYYISKIYVSKNNDYAILDCTYMKKNDNSTGKYDKYILNAKQIRISYDEYSKLCNSWKSVNEGNTLYWNCCEIGFEKGKGAYIKG